LTTPTTETPTTGTATTTTLTTTANLPAEKPNGYTPPASQEELDRIVSTRLAREREKFADYDDLKAKAAKHDESLEAAKTDAEKAIEAARAEGEKTARESANRRLVASEARALAAEAKFRNPSLAAKAVDLTAVTVDADGNVDADAIKTKLAALADADPYLIDDGKTGGPRPDRSQGGGKTSPTATVAAGRELYDARRPRRTEKTT
jgi:hypothetical protein